jgi:hypothetical protein
VRSKIDSFGKEITGTKVTNPKSALAFNFYEDIGFRDDNYHNFFCDIWW